VTLRFKYKDELVIDIQVRCSNIQLQQEVLLSFHNRSFKQRINLQYLQTDCAVKSSFDINFKKTRQPSLIVVATCLEVSLHHSCFIQGPSHVPFEYSSTV
jgi:hypothetical protein